jgi:rubrerythrin
MSIVESLIRLVDPVQAQEREESRRIQREQPKREAAGDPPRHRCRICGLVDEAPVYCPVCLADTMRPIGISESV